MQAEDDERRELERILSARPSGNDRDQRAEALRRLRALGEDSAQKAAVAPDAPPTRRRGLLLAVAVAGGVALGALATSAVLLPPTAGPSGAPTASAAPADRFATLVARWEPTTDIPAGLALLAGDAPVYSPAFDTVQDDRVLITAPDPSALCLALERPDATFAASCTGADAFWAGEPLRISGTALLDGSPVYTQVILHPDGSIEGGYQLVPASHIM